MWLVGRTQAKLEAVAAATGQGNGRVTCCTTDLSRDDAVTALAGRLREEAGVVDVLVHSAGVISLGPVASLPVEEFDRQYRVNVRAPYLLTQLLLPMLRLRQGQIVFINSTAGTTAGANVGQYAATKFALKALADSLRAEVNADGVRVLTVSAGRTATPMQAAIHELEGKTYRPAALSQPEDVAALVLAGLTVPRTTELTDLALRPMEKP